MISDVSNPLTHPSTHQKKHPPMGGGILHRFQIFKRNRNISIRSSLIAFLLIWGVHPPHTHVHAHAPTHTYVRTCMHVKHGCIHGGGHLQFPNMFILVFHACVCMHVHVHMSRDTPHAPRCPPTHLPPLQSRREPKSPKVYKS